MKNKKKKIKKEKHCSYCGRIFYTNNNNQFQCGSSCKALIKNRVKFKPFGVQIRQSKMNDE